MEFSYHIINDTEEESNNQDTPNNDTDFCQHHPLERERKFAFLRYLFLTAIAWILTAVCPGNTIFWKDRTSTKVYATLATLMYCLTAVSFFFLQRSDPGCITPEVLTQGIEGGESLLSELMENDETTVAVLESNANDVESNDDHEDLLAQSNTTVSSTKPYQTTTTTAATTLDEEYECVGTSRARSTLKYRKPCNKCNLPRRPLRSHHCSNCNRCVATLDHHCSTLENCIGERNYIRFYMLLCWSR